VRKQLEEKLGILEATHNAVRDHLAEIADDVLVENEDAAV